MNNIEEKCRYIANDLKFLSNWRAIGVLGYLILHDEVPSYKLKNILGPNAFDASVTRTMQNLETKGIVKSEKRVHFRFYSLVDQIPDRYKFVIDEIRKSAKRVIGDKS